MATLIERFRSRGGDARVRIGPLVSVYSSKTFLHNQKHPRKGVDGFLAW